MAETEPLTRAEDEVDAYLKLKQHPKTKLLDEIFSDGKDTSTLGNEQIKDAKEEYFKRLEEMFQGTTDDQGEVIEPTEAQAAAEKVIDSDRERLNALDEALATDPAARYLVLLADEVSRFRNHRLAEGDHEPALQNRLDDAEQKFQDVYDDYENNEGSEDVLGYVLEKAFAPTIPEHVKADQEPQSDSMEVELTEEDEENIRQAYKGDPVAFSAVFDKFAGQIAFHPSETQQAIIERARAGDEAAILESLTLLEDADAARVGISPVENLGAPTSESDIHLDGSPEALQAAQAQAAEVAESARLKERAARDELLQNKRSALTASALAGDVAAFDELISLYPHFEPDAEQNFLILQARGGDSQAMGEAIGMLINHQEDRDEHIREQAERARIENDPTFILSQKSTEDLGNLAMRGDMDAFNVYLGRFNQVNFSDEQRALFAEVQAGNTDKLGEAVGEIYNRDDEIKQERQTEITKDGEKIEWEWWRKNNDSFKDIFTKKFWATRWTAATADGREFYQDKRDGFLNRGITEDMDEYQKEQTRNENRRNFMIGAQVVGAGIAALVIINNMNNAFNGSEVAANIGGSKGGTGGATGSETLNDNGNGSTGGQSGAEAGGVTGTEVPTSAEFIPDPALNVPVGGGGEAMFNRLGIPIEKWYENEFDWHVKYPNETYVLDGHIAFSNPGTLSQGFQEDINKLRQG